MYLQHQYRQVSFFKNSKKYNITPIKISGFWLGEFALKLIFLEKSGKLSLIFFTHMCIKFWLKGYITPIKQFIFQYKQYNK